MQYTLFRYDMNKDSRAYVVDIIYITSPSPAVYQDRSTTGPPLELGHLRNGVNNGFESGTLTIFHPASHMDLIHLVSLP